MYYGILQTSNYTLRNSTLSYDELSANDYELVRVENIYNSRHTPVKSCRLIEEANNHPELYPFPYEAKGSIIAQVDKDNVRLFYCVSNNEVQEIPCFQDFKDKFHLRLTKELDKSGEIAHLTDTIRLVDSEDVKTALLDRIQTLEYYNTVAEKRWKEKKEQSEAEKKILQSPVISR